MSSVLEAVFYRPVVEVADGLHNGKPQAVAFLSCFSRAEPAEQSFTVKRLAVGSGVAYGEAAVADSNQYLAAACRMANGVHDKILQHTFQ